MEVYIHDTRRYVVNCVKGPVEANFTSGDTKPGANVAVSLCSTGG